LRLHEGTGLTLCRLHSYAGWLSRPESVDRWQISRPSVNGRQGG
jgi:hypothetical protein